MTTNKNCTSLQTSDHRTSLVSSNELREPNFRFKVSQQKHCECLLTKYFPSSFSQRLYCTLYLIPGHFWAITRNKCHVIFFRLRDVGMLPHLYPPFSRGRGVFPELIPVSLWAKARVHPGWVTSSSQGPYWWQRPPHKLPTAHQEQFWGSVSCSRILWHVAQFHPGGAGIQTSDLTKQMSFLNKQNPLYNCQ